MDAAGKRQKQQQQQHATHSTQHTHTLTDTHTHTCGRTELTTLVATSLHTIRYEWSQAKSTSAR